MSVGSRWIAGLGSGLCMAALAGLGCTPATDTAGHAVTASKDAPAAAAVGPQTGGGGVYSGFDRNDYPGDGVMASMHNRFAFTGYWVTDPPGETTNSWMGKRGLLRQQGWGFLVLANGRLDAEILKAQKGGHGHSVISPAELGRKDAAIAVAAAQREGFPAHTILFLDQEEGGRLLDEQAGYLLGWTEAVAATDFRPGVYASGQPVPDEPGKTITTIDHIRSRVQSDHLHEIAMFDAQDACPPAPGCVVQPPPLDASGEPGLIAWQYAQSPRRPDITKACARTYASDGNCYATGFSTIFLDMDAASSADPSHGR